MLPLPQTSYGNLSKEQAKHLAQQILTAVIFSQGRTSEQVAYDLFYGHQDALTFDYLTRVGKHYMPAKVRMMAITKPYFDILESTAESRTPPMRVYAVDDASVQERNNARARKLVDTLLDKGADRMERIGMMRARLQQQRQATVENQDPIAANAMELQLSRLEQQAQRNEDVTNSDLAEAERKFRSSFQTQKERTVNDALEYLFQKYGWKNLFQQGFKDQLVVDNQIYRIEDVFAGQDPRIRKCNPQDVWYSANPESPYLDEAHWIVEKRQMKAEVLIEQYGHEMNAENLAKIKEACPHLGMTPNEMATSSNNYVANGMGQPVGNCADEVYAGSAITSQNMIEVHEIEWRSVRRVDVDEDGAIIELGDRVTDNEPKAPKKKIDRRYVSEYWRAKFFLGDIWVGVERCPFQHRDIEHIGKAFSSYSGYAFNGRDNRPYSRVLAVRDAQILYNLVNYHIELLLALGGMKGIIMDITQKPAHMPNDEWLMNMKRGLMLVNPGQVDEETGKRSNWNQYTTYDMTFGNSIAPLRDVLDRIEVLIGKIIGIPPQRLGDVAQRESPGSVQQANAQSSLTTEVLFIRDRRIKERVLQKAINMIPFVWKDGRRGAYVLGGQGQKLFDAKAGELEDARMELFYGDGGKEQAQMERVLQLAMNEYSAKQTISLREMTALFNMNTLSELEESLEHFEKLAIRRATSQGEAAEQARQEAEQRSAEIKAMLDSKAGEVDQMKNAIQQRQLELEQYRIDSTNQVKLQTEGARNQVQLQDIATEERTERAFLQEDARKTDIDAVLRRMEMMLEGLTNGAKGIPSGSSAKQKVSDR